jgi:hypothetical protein
MSFREIEDIKIIHRLGNELDKTLRAKDVHEETRRIGYPGGHEYSTVYFLENNGPDSLWYVRWKAEQLGRVVTLLGHGEYGSDEWLSIDVQFNYPLEDFHRRLGAAFLEDTTTGEKFLAHRGIVTLRSRVPKDRVLEAMAADVVAVENASGSDEYILAASLSSKTLLDDLSKFSRRLRNAVRALGKDSDDPVEEVEDKDEHAPGQPGSPDQSSRTYMGFDDLRDYFAEFSGERRAFTPRKVIAVAHHGKVVHALYEEMVERGRALKSRAVDLVVDVDTHAVLFEVKTKADTQSIYTAVGQLTVHASTTEKILGKSVRKVLVVPEMPTGSLGDLIRNELGILMMTYTISRDGCVYFPDMESTMPKLIEL